MESLVVVACAPALDALLASLKGRYPGVDEPALDELIVDTAAALARGFKQSDLPSDGNRKVALLLRPGHDPGRLQRALEGVPARVVEVAPGDIDRGVAEALRHEVDRGARAVVAASVLAATLPPYLVDHAFRALLFHDVVVGPDFAGRSYLVGLRRPPADFALALAWNPTPALRDLLDAAGRGANLALLPFWYQLGDDASLAWLETHLRVLRGRPWLLTTTLPELVAGAGQG